MNTGTVSRLLTHIPERAARMQSGCAFVPETSASPHPGRVAHLVKFLSWLSPLAALSKDDQRVLGLTAANGRPVQAASADEEGEDHELDAESDSELDSEDDSEVDSEDDSEVDSEDDSEVDSEDDAENGSEVDAEPVDEWEPAPASGVVQHPPS